jgi:DNA-binding winged helix-turn-helix (wHTH) protein
MVVRLRFESFELDSETAELFRKGNRLRLQDQPARLLVLLASRSRELVTRAEIREALWPEGEFVEFEHAINTAMRKIRAVLEDDAEHPRLIETVPRKGYRFIGAVDIVNAASPSAPAPPAPPPGAVAAPVPGRPAEPEIALDAGHARRLFLFIQVGYLLMYLSALVFSSDLDVALTSAGFVPLWLSVPVTVIVAMCGIAVRLYLLSSVALRHPSAPRQFGRLFPFMFILDALWAASPLLIARFIGIGAALASACGLAYLPFSQRTLIGRIGRGDRDALRNE